MGGSAIVAMALAVQSCGVMSSPGDCMERATCEGVTGADATDETETGPVADDGPGSDQGIGEAESGVAEGSSAEADVAELDVAMDDVTGDVEPDVRGDVTNDVAADREAGPGDGAPRDVVAEDAPPVGCVDGGPENCTDGIDNNCDGRIDCADPLCSAFACAQPVPSTGGTWFGPALLWTAPIGTTPPSCPGGYQKAADAFQNPTGTPDGCTCNCSPSGQACTTSGTFMSRMDCTQQCATASPINSGACTTVSTNTCGTQGSFTAATPTPSGGTCTPQVTTTPGTAANWSTVARICVLSSGADTPGGCTGANEQCVALGGTGFNGTPCIYQAGTATCPASYPNLHTVYSGENDSRGCGTCTCSPAPTGGSCAGSIALFGTSAGGCTGTPPATFTLGQQACTSGAVGLTYSGLTLNPGFVQANFTVTPGTCSVATAPTPTGSVTPIGPTTVCCM